MDNPLPITVVKYTLQRVPFPLHTLLRKPPIPRRRPTAAWPSGVGHDVEPQAIQKAFGNVLRRLRADRGLSQEALAFESGLSRTYIAYLEQGRYNPTLLSVLRLARGLKMKPSDLVREWEQEMGIR